MDRAIIERKLKDNEIIKSELKAHILSLFDKVDKDFEEWDSTQNRYKRFSEYKETILNKIDKPAIIQISLAGLTVYSRLFEGPKDIADNLNKLVGRLEEYCDRCYSDSYIKSLEDTAPVHFSGDIIVTDPCYLMNKDSNRDNWKICDCGDSLDELGFTNYLSRSTNCGDWSCTLYGTEDNKVYGKFCADSGKVCVVLADEVFKYNPNFKKDFLENRDWCAAIIKDFEGDVHFRIDEVKFDYKDKECFDYEVKVVINGVNKKTGEPIHLISSQTGL